MWSAGDVASEMSRQQSCILVVAAASGVTDDERHCFSAIEASVLCDCVLRCSSESSCNRDSEQPKTCRAFHDPAVCSASFKWYVRPLKGSIQRTGGHPVRHFWGGKAR